MKKKIKFTIVDPSKQKKKKWIQTIPTEDKQQFKNFRPLDSTEFTLQEPKIPSFMDTMIQKIDKKLEGTGFTFEKLEKKYRGDSLVHALYEMNGNTVWFNDKFMEVFKRDESHYMSLNVFEVFQTFNPDHPATTLLPQLVYTHADSLKFDTSGMVSALGVEFSSKAVLERVDKNDEVFGYLLHSELSVKPSESTEFTLEEPKNPTVHDTMVHKINEKLQGTCWTFEKLEETFSKDTLVHAIFEMNGNSIWFNKAFIKYFKRTESEFLSVNILDTYKIHNPDHPTTTVLPKLLYSKAKYLKYDSSDMVSSLGVVYSSRTFLERVDKNNQPFGYLVHCETILK
eukprot:gene8058-12520_t